MNRRRALKLLGAAGGLAVGGRFALLPPGRSPTIGEPNDLAVRFTESLDAEARGLACVDYDHPLRQYHNRGVWGGGLWATPLNLGWEQRRLLTDLLHSGLSAAGRERLPKEFYTYWPGVHSMRVLICGDPKAPPYQVILTGAHLNLRIGGQSREGAAFGGPVVYGDQRGDSVPGLPGNLYRFQLQTAQELFRSLSSAQQQLALVDTSPNQTAIQLQGSQGRFDGVDISTLSKASRALARQLIDEMLSTYPAHDVGYAWQCLEHNGGPERLFLSYYRDSAAGTSPCQNVRLEGPAAVFYLRGFPHVHAFINVTMQPDQPLSVGEELAHNPAPIEGARVARLFEAAMQEGADADLGYYDVGSVAGRLPKGSIRTGDLYALESWQDSVARVEIRGSQLNETLRSALRERGLGADSRKTFTIATPTFSAESLGRVDSATKVGLLRDVTVAYVRKRGFSAIG